MYVCTLYVNSYIHICLFLCLSVGLRVGCSCSPTYLTTSTQAKKGPEQLQSCSSSTRDKLDSSRLTISVTCLMDGQAHVLVG